MVSAFVRQFSHEDVDRAGAPRYKQFQRDILNLELKDLPAHKEMIDALVKKYCENWAEGLGSESLVEDTFCRSQLRNCIFVGHVNTDLDSIAGAVGASVLFRGVAARSEEKMNGEIEFALKWIGMEPPPLFDDLPGAAAPDANGRLAKVCLVDHNEVDQMTPALKYDPGRMKRIAGLIDHHALAPSFVSSSPLFIDVRPWGSMASIIFMNFLRNRVPIQKEIACLLLCAILSDTLNLKSGTTTPADRFCVALLATFGEVENIDDLAKQLFQAKTEWIVGLGAYEMIRGDQKNFKVGDVRMSIAVLEVTSMDPVFEVAEDLLTQMRVFKYEKGDYIDPDTHENAHDPDKEVHCAMLFIVDTVKQVSSALICGARELYAAQKAFPDATFSKCAPDVRPPSVGVQPEETRCDVGALVSRKLDFLPKITDALQNEPVPEWFCATSKDMERLAKVLQSGLVDPLVHTSVQVLWDKATLKAAVFNDTSSLKKLHKKMTTVSEWLRSEEVEQAQAVLSEVIGEKAEGAI